LLAFAKSDEKFNGKKKEFCWRSIGLCQLW